MSAPSHVDVMDNGRSRGLDRGEKRRFDRRFQVQIAQPNENDLLLPVPVKISDGK